MTGNRFLPIFIIALILISLFAVAVQALEYPADGLGPFSTNWLNGSTCAPDPSVGFNGDYYLCNSGEVYHKSSNSWSFVTYLNGTQGIQGVQGPQGIQGIPGPNGPNDLSGTTTTALTGVFCGNGANVGICTFLQDVAYASTGYVDTHIWSNVSVLGNWIQYNASAMLLTADQHIASNLTVNNTLVSSAVSTSTANDLATFSTATGRVITDSGSTIAQVQAGAVLTADQHIGTNASATLLTADQHIGSNMSTVNNWMAQNNSATLLTADQHIGTNASATLLTSDSHIGSNRSQIEAEIWANTSMIGNWIQSNITVNKTLVSSDVTSSTSGDIATFNSATGRVITDSGSTIAQVQAGVKIINTSYQTIANSSSQFAYKTDVSGFDTIANQSTVNNTIWSTLNQKDTIANVSTNLNAKDSIQNQSAVNNTIWSTLNTKETIANTSTQLNLKDTIANVSTNLNAKDSIQNQSAVNNTIWSTLNTKDTISNVSSHKVEGAASSVDQDIAIFSGVTGHLLADSSTLISSLATAASCLLAADLHIATNASATLLTADNHIGSNRTSIESELVTNRSQILAAVQANQTIIQGEILSNRTAIEGEIWSNVSTINTWIDQNLTAMKGNLGNFTIMAQSIYPMGLNGATVTAPNSTGMSNITWYSLDFPDATSINATVEYIMPSSWNTTYSALNATFYWTATGSSGTAVWDFAARCGPNAFAIDGPYSLNVTTASTLAALNQVTISSPTAPTVPWGSPGPNAICWFKFARDSGTLTTSASLLGVRINYVVQ